MIRETPDRWREAVRTAAADRGVPHRHHATTVRPQDARGPARQLVDAVMPTLRAVGDPVDRATPTCSCVRARRASRSGSCSRCSAARSTSARRSVAVGGRRRRRRPDHASTPCSPRPDASARRARSCGRSPRSRPSSSACSCSCPDQRLRVVDARARPAAATVARELYPGRSSLARGGRTTRACTRRSSAALLPRVARRRNARRSRRRYTPGRPGPARPAAQRVVYEVDECLLTSSRPARASAASTTRRSLAEAERRADREAMVGSSPKNARSTKRADRSIAERADPTSRPTDQHRRHSGDRPARRPTEGTPMASDPLDKQLVEAVLSPTAPGARPRSKRPSWPRCGRRAPDAAVVGRVSIDDDDDEDSRRISSSGRAEAPGRRRRRGRRGRRARARRRRRQAAGRRPGQARRRRSSRSRPPRSSRRSRPT